MRVTIYLKDGAIVDIEKAYDVEHIDWYEEREVWIHYDKDSIAKYKEKDIEEIKVRMG